MDGWMDARVAWTHGWITGVHEWNEMNARGGRTEWMHERDEWVNAWSGRQEEIDRARGMEWARAINERWTTGVAGRDRRMEWMNGKDTRDGSLVKTSGACEWYGRAEWLHG
eukprot:2803545-Lingulodinium_polyedra.AAC.1